MSGERVPVIAHETEEQLELYALGRLTEAEAAGVEEHLLVCAACRDRLDEAEAFALAMREAVATDPASEARSYWPDWFRLRRPVLVWAGGLAVAVLAVGLYPGLGGHGPAPVATLELTAMRGNTPEAEPARETDIVLGDAPATGALEAKLVDGSGVSVWSGVPEAGSHRLRVEKRLAPGGYFVRLYGGAAGASGEALLHEYAFVVRNPR